MTPSHQTFSQYKAFQQEKEDEATAAPVPVFPEDLQTLWDNTAQKSSCDLLSCDTAIDICDPHEDAISIEIEHPETGIRKYLWFCCEAHKEAAFEAWPILEKQQVRFF